MAPIPDERSASPAHCATLHAPFLARAAGDECSNGSSALGAFLALRLVDQLTIEAPLENAAAVRYQIKATRAFLDDLNPRTAEVTHLRELMRVAAAALQHRERRLLFPPMLAYAYWLEQQLRLEDALDVLQTALRLSDGRDAEEEVAAHLQRGRVLRLTGCLDEAVASYSRGRDAAANLGDTHSELLGQIGHAVTLQKLGNISESEKVLRSVVAEAARLRDTDVEARACHDLAITLYFGGRLTEAVPLAFRAFSLHTQPIRRVRALSDTGLFLKDLGLHTAAKNAFTHVLVREPPPEVRVRTTLEMLELSCLMNDQVSFERWRRSLARSYSELPPEEKVDFQMKVGSGLARFGRAALAEKHYRKALKLAEQYRMGERIFRAEALLDALAGQPGSGVAADVPPPVAARSDSELEETLQSISALAATS